MEKLFIISNESIFQKKNTYFCDNIDLKSTPEGLNKKFEVNIIGRKSKKERVHEINVKNIKTFGSIFSYISGLVDSFKCKDSKYLIISISPYTFLACIFLKLFKKKPIVYLRSDGYKEYRSILGFMGVAIYHLMFSFISRTSSLISCRKHILREKKGKVVLPSQLDEDWFTNYNEANLKEFKLLYVGRIKIEKGIYSLLKLIKDRDNLSLTIVGAEKNKSQNINQNNVKVLKNESNKIDLIKFCDNHNIFVLPSFTEGHPMSLLEALARKRPVVIFEEIQHVIGEKKGIFVSKRNYESFIKTIEYIKKNYREIQEEMKQNKLPTNKEFIKSMENSITNFN